MTLELLKHFVRKVLCTQVNYREYAGNFCPSVIRVKSQIVKKRRANRSECVCGPAMKPIDGSAVN